MAKTKPILLNRNSSSHPPTITLVATNDLLRDMMVKLRHPKKVSEVSDLRDPYEELVKNMFSFADQGITIDQLKTVIYTMLERKLLRYKPESHSFHLTEKAGKIFEELYVIICSNCGASNIKPDDSSSANLCCRNCKQKI